MKVVCQWRFYPGTVDAADSSTFNHIRYSLQPERMVDRVRIIRNLNHITGVQWRLELHVNRLTNNSLFHVCMLELLSEYCTASLSTQPSNLHVQCTSHLQEVVQLFSPVSRKKKKLLFLPVSEIELSMTLQNCLNITEITQDAVTWPIDLSKGSLELHVSGRHTNKFPYMDAGAIIQLITHVCTCVCVYKCVWVGVCVYVQRAKVSRRLTVCALLGPTELWCPPIVECAHTPQQLQSIPELC